MTIEFSTLVIIALIFFIFGMMMGVSMVRPRSDR